MPSICIPGRVLVYSKLRPEASAPDTKEPPTPDQSRTLSPYDTLTHSRAANVDDVQNCTAGAGEKQEEGERSDSGAGHKNATATSAAEVLDLCGGGTLLSGASFARARLRADECFRRVVQQALSLAAPPCGLQGYWEWRVRNYWSVPSSLCLLYTSPSPRDGLLSRMPSSA